MDKELQALLECGRQVRTAQEQVDEGYAEEMGYDCGMNGANGTNSHFAIFSQPQYTKAWERGVKRAAAEKLKRGGPQSGSQ